MQVNSKSNKERDMFDRRVKTFEEIGKILRFNK